MSRYHKYCLILVCVGLCLVPLSADDVRDKSHQPEKVNHSTNHFLSREEILEKIEESVFELERLETFLPQHNIYIIRMKT